MNSQNPVPPKLSEMRQEYHFAELHREHLHPNPFLQFNQWLSEAVSFGIKEPNAMALSTVDQNGQPSSRMVLLKEINERGFTFFTNYESRKGIQLKYQPKASLLFYWPELQRQIRIEGRVEKTSLEESEAYFQSRPTESQIGAWISKQSQVLENREELEQAFAQLVLTGNEKQMEKPPFWGGYLVRPDFFEFWQGGRNRLHYRFTYHLSEEKWEINCLYP